MKYKRQGQNPRVDSRELLARIKRFQRLTGIRDARLGRDMMNDPAFVTRLKAGRDVWKSTMERVNEWLDARWPEPV